MHIKIDSNIELTYFGIVYHAGAAWEKPGLYGTSHLMEHLMCKTYEHLYPKMRKYGIEDNAYTSSNNVLFFLSGIDGYTTDIAQEMLDCLTEQKTLWTEDQFNTEKNIVLQEYGDSFEEPFSGFYLNFFRRYYDYYNPIGLKSNIERFSYEDSLKAAKDIFSTPKA